MKYLFKFFIHFPVGATTTLKRNISIEENEVCEKRNQRISSGSFGGGSHNKKWCLGHFGLWPQKSPAASPQHVVTSASTPPRLPLIWLRPHPLLTDWTLRAQPLWCKTPHCCSCLTLHSVITCPMLTPGYHRLVQSGKCFLDHQQSVAHHHSLYSQIPAELESVEALSGAAAPSASDYILVF